MENLACFFSIHYKFTLNRKRLVVFFSTTFGFGLRLFWICCVCVCFAVAVLPSHNLCVILCVFFVVNVMFFPLLLLFLWMCVLPLNAL